MALLLWLILNGVCDANILTAELPKEATNKGKKIHNVEQFVLKEQIDYSKINI